MNQLAHVQAAATHMIFILFLLQTYDQCDGRGLIDILRSIPKEQCHIQGFLLRGYLIQ